MAEHFFWYLFALMIILGPHLTIAATNRENVEQITMERVWTKVWPALQDVAVDAVADILEKQLREMHPVPNEAIQFFNAIIEEDCEEFFCPEGFTRITNPRHVPSYNGCGALGLQWKRDLLPEEALEECCNEHDLCYDACGADRDGCDLHFKRCLFSTCKRARGSDASIKGVHAIGCKAFQDAQEKACVCVPLFKHHGTEL